MPPQPSPCLARSVEEGLEAAASEWHALVREMCLAAGEQVVAQMMVAAERH